jgi:hypothetical protein
VQRREARIWLPASHARRPVCGNALGGTRRRRARGDGPATGKAQNLRRRLCHVAHSEHFAEQSDRVAG